MIRLPNVRLAAATTTQLSVWQDEVLAAGDYAAQIKAAEKQFSNRNKATNKTFKVVRATLGRMCSGAQRCVYCEDSAGIEVEHMQPKSFYPELVFAFGNYVYACGRCNRYKSNRAAVFNAAGDLVELVRVRNAPLTLPPTGQQALINPRREDAAQWLMLDLRDTFEFVPIAAVGTPDRKRADFVLSLLRLNDPDILVPARREAHDNYRARLMEYLMLRNAGAPASELKQLVKALQRMQHPTVWFEIKRQAPRLASWQPLFAQAPEAMDW